MSGRGLLILGALALLAVAGAVLTRQPPGDLAETAEQPRFLPRLHEQTEAVTRLDVRAPDGRDLARIVRGESGWTVANRRDHPADLTTLRGTLIGLAEARRLEEKTDRPEGHARIGVAEPGSGEGAGVEIALRGTDPPLAVLIGDSAAVDEARATHVRRVGEDRAWLVSGELERHDEIADWLDDELVDIPAIRVHRVRVEPVDGEPVRVVLPAPNAPRFEILDIPEGREPLSRTLSKSIARGVADLRLTDVRPAAETSLPPRLATARFELFDGLVIEIEVFAPGRGEFADGLARIRADALPKAAPEIRARANALNARFEDWLYRLPEYKFVNLTYRFEQVLAPE